MHILNLLRVKDWLKNILIFFPLIFSGLLFDQSNYTILLFGFITFNVIASSIYVINDILDVEVDKLHPVKKFSKPIASNNISLNTSYFILLFLIISSVILINLQPSLYLSVFLYLSIALSYNFFFKRVPYFELIILSIGYVIRIDAGSRLILVDSSILMLSSTFFLALYFLVIKRVSEINHFQNDRSNKTRYILKFYNKKILQKIIIFLIFSLIINLLIYTLIRNLNLILSIVFVILFLLKYYSLSKESTVGENPINLIFNNYLLLFLCIIIMVSSLVIYINN